MENIWHRIETWLALNAPTTAGSLNPPATREEIAATEQFLGVTLPEDVRTAYLRHNGQGQNALSLWDSWEWLPLERVREEWQIWKELRDGGTFEGFSSEADGVKVRTDWWNPGWIPLTYDDCGDHLCVDLAPGPEGIFGQIIEMWHDRGERDAVAGSFEAWLSDYVAGLEKGLLVVTEYGIKSREES